MCITFFYIPAPNSNDKFILSFNRDESFQKKTAILSSFEEDPNIIAGRDLEGKGTWCGINKETGVVAFLTNYHTQSYHDILDIKYGRGNLTFRFLKTEFANGKQNEVDQKIYEGLVDILNEIKEYNAFNLVIGSIKTNKFYYICNPYNKKIKITPKPELLKQGQAYVLTNTDIHTYWPKSEYGLKLFKQIINSHKTNVQNQELSSETHGLQLFVELQKLMFDRTMFDEDPESESSVFIPQYLSKYSKKYFGTVSSCYIILDNNIKGIYKEIYLVDKDFNQLNENQINTIINI